MVDYSGAELRKLIAKTCMTNNSELIDFIISESKLRRVRKKELLVQKGNTISYLYILVNGISRWFYKTEREEYTIGIDVNAGDVLNGEWGIDNNLKALFSIQMLTDGFVIEIPIHLMREVSNRYAEIMEVYFHYLYRYNKSRMELKYILTLSAVEKCLWFHAKYPGVEGKIQKQYIAGFLRMTLSTYGKTMKKIQMMD